MKYAFALVACFALFVATANAQFQFESKDGEKVEAKTGAAGPKLGASQRQIWRAGVIIAAGTLAEDVYIALPLPMEWPEQKIIRLEEVKREGPITGNLNYRVVNNGCKEMSFRVSKMQPKRKLEVVVEVEIENFELLPPGNPDAFVIPKRLHRDVEQYVKSTTCIESGNTQFVKMFHEITKDKPTDWEKVEAIYTFVQRNVNYDETVKAKEAKGALALISQPEGQWKADCKDMCCLFVAICRAGKIPARLVRVPEHCYAEFYLEPKDSENKGGKTVQKTAPGFWFPCQVAGTYSFGGIPERQPILQKGDSFPDMDSTNKRAKYIFLKEYCEANVPDGSIPPNPKFIHEVRGK